MYTNVLNWKTFAYSFIVFIVIGIFATVCLTESLYQGFGDSLVFVNASFLNSSDDESVSIDATAIVVVPSNIDNLDLGEDKSLIKYVVQPGDTLSEIARDYGTTVSKLKTVNKLNNTTLRIGKTIYIASVDGIIYTIKEKTNPMVFVNKWDLGSLDDFMTTNNFHGEMRLLEKGEEIFVPGMSYKKAIEVGLLEKPKPKPKPKPKKSIKKVNKSSGAYVVRKIQENISKPQKKTWIQSVANAKNKSRKKDVILSKWVDKKRDGARMAAGHCTSYAARNATFLFPYTSKSSQYRGATNGNAKQRYRKAKSAGLTVSSIPSIGSVIVMNVGSVKYRVYGHVGIVKDVDWEKHTIVIEEMNYAGRYIVTKRLIHLNDSMTQKYGSKNYIIGYIPVQELPEYHKNRVKQLKKK